MAAVGLLGSLIWLGFFGVAARHRDWVRRVRDLPVNEPAGGWPSVAVLFAARDEARSVEQAARTMLALDYPWLEVVAIDDRSTDGTGEILDRLAAEDRRMRVVHVAELPAGWLGKTHALQVGAEETSAEWLLFTDADVMFDPLVLRRTVGHAVAEGLDHLTVTPDLPTQGEGERVFLAMFQVGLALYAPGWDLEKPRKKAAMGIGAFNLVRASAFRAIGGFERIALSVDDDVQLGRSLKWAGYRSRMVLGTGAISVRWQQGLGGMIRGLEKNFFAGSRFDLGRVALYTLGQVVVGFGPFLGLISGPAWVRGVCGVAIVVMAILLTLMGRQCGLRPYHALTMPLSAMVCIAALLRSTWKTLRQRGICWRGHLYPLAPLRDHVRRRERWMRELWLSTR
jgi:cellulose synthase/poly-beta-1,6-N-acetylglucosamine synthase-like glycosyltransferase